MGGIEAVRAAMLAHTPLTDLVPATKIIGDDVVPGDIAYPAITLMSVSTVPLHTLNPGGTIHFRERVQVTIYAASRPERKLISDAVYDGCAYAKPTVVGISGVTIHLDNNGPDFIGDDNARIGTQDFIVRYTRATPKEVVGS